MNNLGNDNFKHFQTMYFETGTMRATAPKPYPGWNQSVLFQELRVESRSLCGRRDSLSVVQPSYIRRSYGPITFHDVTKIGHQPSKAPQNQSNGFNPGSVKSDSAPQESNTLKPLCGMTPLSTASSFLSNSVFLLDENHAMVTMVPNPKLVEQWNTVENILCQNSE